MAFRIEKSKFEDQIVEPQDHLLEGCNIDTAGKLARSIRDEIGTYRYKEMWAEKTVWLADDRRVDLQASVRELIINIGSTGTYPYRTNARWDTKRNILTAFGLWDCRQDRYSLYFQVAEKMPSIPATFSYAQASHKFSEILEQIGRPDFQPSFMTIALAQLLTA